jgi:hypothetical protein
MALGLPSVFAFDHLEMGMSWRYEMIISYLKHYTYAIILPSVGFTFMGMLPMIIR